MDYAVTALWFIAVMAGIKGAKSYWWLLLTGITVGLTMLTKFHGFLLFFPLGGYFIWKRRYIRFGLIAVVACAVYIVGWPWMWTETLAHFGEYLHMQFIHGSVPEYVLGHLYPFAPWWYPTLMFMVTTPVFLLITFFVGAYRTITKGNSFDKIILINALFPILFFSLPGVYRYDWVRLFLPAFPFVCLVAGMGIKFLSRKIPVAVFWGLWFVTIFFSVIRIYPWVSSYYNELVGGPAGAASLGFESEYYGNAYLGVLPWMNGHKSDMMCVPFTKHAVDYYQAMGQIEAGVVFGATGDACRYEIILMRQGFIMQDAYISKLVAKRRPVFAVTLDGVSLVGVYDRTGIKN
jgi:4-amino-4-deoxy-L-arabinose transferase-like glycosyltransferase